MMLVTTGRTPDGTSVFVEDARPAALTAPGFPSLVNTPLWGADQAVVLPTDGVRAPSTSFFPPAGGYRFFVLTFEPESADAAGVAPTDDQLTAFEALFPGLLATWEPDDPGMHSSDTIDFGIVLRGRVALELDHGEQRVLDTGDAFVQNGTRHRWRNPDATAATIAVVAVGTEHLR